MRLNMENPDWKAHEIRPQSEPNKRSGNWGVKASVSSPAQDGFALRAGANGRNRFSAYFSRVRS